LRIADCGFIADCGVRIADLLRIAGCRLIARLIGNNPQSAIANHSAIRTPQSPINPHSAIRNPQ